MFRHYLLTAIRNAWRHRVTTAINILGLALGLTFFILAWGFLTLMENGDRQFDKSDRIYFIAQTTSAGDLVLKSARSPQPLAAYLRADFSALEHVAQAREADELPISAGGKKTFANVAMADAEFLRVFHLPFLGGDDRRALDKPRSIILTRATAQRLFGATDIVGRSVQVGGLALTVTAVMDRIEGPSHIGPSAFSISATLNFDALASMDVGARLDDQPSSAGPHWGDDSYVTYLVLPANGSLSASALNRALPAFVRRHVPADLKMEIEAKPIWDLSLVTDIAALGLGIPFRALTLILGSFILCVGCVNYANLAGALAIGRVREIGLRKVLGAGRGQLVSQYLFESILHAAMALVIALLAAVLMLPMMDRYFGFGVGLFLTTIPSFLIGLLVVLGVVGLVAGAYPAIVALRAMPATALRVSARRGTGFGLKLLVALQFSLAGTLLVIVIVINMQKGAMLAFAPAPSTDPVVIVGHLQRADVNMKTFEAELRQIPSIETISATEEAPWSEMTLGGMEVQHTPNQSEKPFLVAQRSVYYDFFETVGTRLLAGRAFSRDHADMRRTNDVNMVVSRNFAEQMRWTPQQAIGKSLYLTRRPPYERAEPLTRVTIIGVVEDKALNAFADSDTKIVYWLDPALAPGPSNMNALIRVQKAGLPATLAAIDRAWERVAPGIPIDRHLLDEQFERFFGIFNSVILGVAAFVACGLFISVSGLVGMTVHTVTRRAHEIGVRRTLGSTVGGIMRLLLGGLTRPILIGSVLGWPLAYVAVRAMLNLFVNPVALTPLPFFLSLILTLLIGILAIAAPAWRAARGNPADVLRYE